MLKLKNPLLFQPKVQRIDDQIALIHDAWDMRILADSYEELELRVLAHITLVWKLLVHTDERHLTTRGKSIRESLLNDFEEVSA